MLEQKIFFTHFEKKVLWVFTNCCVDSFKRKQSSQHWVWTHVLIELSQVTETWPCQSCQVVSWIREIIEKKSSKWLQHSKKVKFLRSSNSANIWLCKKNFNIELKEKGSTFAKIAKDKKMNESSIRTIYQNRDKIRDQCIQTADYTAMIPMIRPRSRAKLEMEETLFIWVENCAKR